MRSRAYFRIRGSYQTALRGLLLALAFGVIGSAGGRMDRRRSAAVIVLLVTTFVAALADWSTR